MGDANFAVRATMASLLDGGQQLLVRTDERETWRSLCKWDSDDALTNELIGFTRDGYALCNCSAIAAS